MTADTAPTGRDRTRDRAGSRRPSVSFYVPALYAGGAERATITLANGLADRGYDVDLVVSFTVGALREAVAADVQVVSLPVPRLPFLGAGASVPSLRRYLRAERPDVLFSAMTYANVVALLAGRAAGVETAVVPVEHTVFPYVTQLKDRVATAMASRLYRRSEEIVAVSSGVAESVGKHAGVDDERLTVIYNPVLTDGVETDAAEPVSHPWFADPDLDVVLGAGRLEPVKGFETLLRAFSRVARARPNSRLVVLGEGGMHDRLHSLADGLGVSDVASFPGYVENPYRFMHRASAFALSSVQEGLPSVLIEALACGCPVVATDCRVGPREILADGAYGRLVPVGDATALADGLLATLDGPVDREALRARAADFRADAVLDEYEALVARRAGYASER